MNALERVYEVNEVPSRPASAEERLMSRFDANALRHWVSSNGVRRNYGDNKLETAKKVIRQRPDLVLEELGEKVTEESVYRDLDDEYNYLREEAHSRDADGWIVLYRGEDQSGAEYIHVGFF